ncbi:hypothetical protein M513_04348, partial [Trichuris suis]
KKSNQDSNSDLPERATKCIQLLSLSSDIVAHDVNDGSMICRCMCMKDTTVSHSMKFMVVNQWKRIARKGSPEETFQHEIRRNKQENRMRSHHDN